MHDRTTITAFTAQAEGFNRSQAANHAGVLAAIVELARAATQERWLEAACGPGVVSRTLAPHVGEIHGYDMTPAMIELARREAAEAGLTNARFDVADATALPIPDGSVDGAVVRFTHHHIPVPLRLMRELARVVAPGGAVVVVDHLMDADPEAAAWSQEIERLRDPAHWFSLTLTRFHALAEQAGLRIEEERVIPFEIPYEDWLHRGGAGEGDLALAEALVADPPPHATCFRVIGDGADRILCLQVWMARLRSV